MTYQESYMKKFIIFALSVILPVIASGQAQIDTKKVRIADFPDKTTKVVLTGKMYHDARLEKAIKERWHISATEFCTLDEYEKLQSDDNYYFLLTVSGQFKKENEPGLTFLTLVKGGDSSGKGLNGMLEVVSFPFASSQEPSGREYVFLPVILDMMQAHVTNSIAKDVNGYIGLPNYSLNISKSGNMNIVFSAADLSTEVTPEIQKAYFNEGVLVLDEDDADEYVSPEKENTLVSYVVAPTDAQPGSYCYKMLFDTQSSTLYYFRKHKISKKFGPGFLVEDVKRICAPRKK